jgi:two-component system cell cycle sensor histidine kinase/response regulator CckA
VTDGSTIWLLATEEAIGGDLRRLVELRAGGATSLSVRVAEGTAHDAVVDARASGLAEPLGFVGRTEADAFGAVAAGADDASVIDGLDLPRFVAFVDRVMLRAQQRRESQNQRAAVAHAEKLAALGTVVAGVAHEINNPLATVSMTFDVLREVIEKLIDAQQEIQRLADRDSIVMPNEIAKLNDLVNTGFSAAETQSALDDVDSRLRTIRDVVRALKIFGRIDDEEKLDDVYLPELLSQVLHIVGKQVQLYATLEHDYSADLPVLQLPRSRLTQVFTNLLINAAHAVESLKRPVHRVRISVRADADAIAVSISDTGPGIPPEIIERIFDPFFTTKSSRSGSTGGSGLGLSISRSILQELGGDLIVESVHGEGATFIAIIPTEGRATETVRATKRKTLPPPPQPARSSVLVIDDEESLLRSVAMALRGRFDVILATDGQEAIELLSSGSKPDAILCDIMMPVVDGPHFYEWLEEHHPELVRKTVFITANVDSASAFLERVDKPVLEKPMTRELLIGTIESILGKTRPAHNA